MNILNMAGIMIITGIETVPIEVVSLLCPTDLNASTGFSKTGKVW